MYCFFLLSIFTLASAKDVFQVTLKDALNPYETYYKPGSIRDRGGQNFVEVIIKLCLITNTNSLDRLFAGLCNSSRIKVLSKVIIRFIYRICN